MKRKGKPTKERSELFCIFPAFDFGSQQRKKNKQSPCLNFVGEIDRLGEYACVRFICHLSISTPHAHKANSRQWLDEFYLCYFIIVVFSFCSQLHDKFMQARVHEECAIRG